MKLSKLLCLLVLLPVFTASLVFAQAGKIVGVVTDSGGETLPGVNVLIEGTTQGAVTDVDGFYFINNVRPGTYRLRASFVGFTAQVVADVRVSTGLTTEIDFALSEEAVGLDEVVVTSERPIVQLDVSANVANLSPAEFEDLPVAGISEVLDLQAGIEPGLQIRGGGLNEIAFVVDGMNMRTGRDQNPFTNISYTALEEVQVQTGGFNAEYGNVRAGIVNVTTKEPSRTRYSFDGLFRYTPAQERSLNSLGKLPGSCDYSDPDNIDPTCNSYWIRPALDPETSLTGTGSWDPYTQRQYADFTGWNSIVEGLQANGFDVTTQDMVEYFKYTHRKDNEVTMPDYEADFTFGGPLAPGISEKLGDLRFLFSYRGQQTAYTIPQTRDHYDADTYQLKLISNLAQGMRLSVFGMRGSEQGVIPDNDATQVSVWRGNIPNYPWQGVYADPVTGISAERGDDIFSDATLGLGDIDHTMLGVNFTHTLNASTFYEVNLQNISSKYRQKFPNLRDDTFLCPDSGVGPSGQACTPGALVPALYTDNAGGITDLGRNSAGVTCFGGSSDVNGDGSVVGYCAGEEPLGYSGTGGNLLTGESTGGHWTKTRDTTDVSVFTGRFDLTSQINRVLQLKTGAELIVSDYNVNSQRISQELGFLYGDFRWDRAPIQGAAYAQGKLEFQGMVANVGLRMDYFDANSDWWEFTPYDQALRGQDFTLDETLPSRSPDAQVFVSPRLGISFPITQNSKLYFNYGHFRQMLSPFDVFGTQSTPQGGIDVIGYPDHPMPLTVAYELGFDQNLFDQFLLRVSGFYRDIREQSRGVRFEGLGGVVEYTTFRPWNYEDVRGAEFTLTKNRGKWIRGFVNYTFLQTKSGNFGYSDFFENSFDMRNYLRSATDYRLSTPLAQPFARMNLSLLTPDDYGPELAGGKPLGDLRVSLLGEWRSGEKWTWQGGGGTFPELQENTAWRDFWNFDLRFTKHINTRVGGAQLFMDINNVFNRKHLYSQAAFAGENRDFDNYMWSLHLPDDMYDELNQVTCTTGDDVSASDCSYSDKQGLPYVWVPGDDQPGDFRDADTPYQPIIAVNTLDTAEPDEYAWFWARDTGTYSRWNGSSWATVADGDVDKALDKKAYIDMPNFNFNTFLNPRRFTVGLRINF